MILSRNEIISLWKKKIIKFEPDIKLSQIGLCSIDLRIGTNFSKLKHNPGITINPTSTIAAGLYDEFEIDVGSSFRIEGNQFVLGTTYEKITLPNNILAMVEGRSTIARWGLSAHVTAPLINPGWSGKITLEFFNHSTLKLELIAGQSQACQLILFRLKKSIPKSVVISLSRYMGQTKPLPEPY